jgi:hypothetical protein
MTDRSPQPTQASQSVIARPVNGTGKHQGADRLRTVIVAIAVAAAFADSSIVVLALPDMFSAFEGATPVKLALVVIACEIAERLFVSRNTVKTQAISVYRKLGVSSRSEAIARAADLGLVRLDTQ